MELRFTIDDAVMNGLQESIHTARATDAVRESIQLMTWAAREEKAGWQVVAVNDAGERHVPVMDALQRARY